MYQNKNQKSLRQTLRKNSSDAERKLWYYLRKNQLKNLKFIRQYGIGRYVVDFYCPKKRPAIELDGSQHMQKAQTQYDLQRTKFINQQNIQVLRFYDNEVFCNTEGVLQKIIDVAEKNITLAPSYPKREINMMKILAENRKAKFDYEIKDTFVAGLVLSGAEVKSVKNGNVSLTGSYATVNTNGASLINCHIGPYKYARDEKYDPTQTRKLLMKKKEINQLLGKEKGLVIIPLEIFASAKGWVKLKLGLGRARKKTDKREYIKNRESKKEIKSQIHQ